MIKTDNLIDSIKAAKESGKGITFLQKGGEEEFLPYEGLFIKAESGLANLTRSGLIKGDRLILQVEDPGIFLILFWACLMGGIIPIPLSLATTDEYRLKLLKVWDILGNAPIAFDENISADFHTYLKEQGKADLRDRVEENSLFPKGFDPDLGELSLVQNTTPEDIAYIQFSSGSTDDPKGIILTHGNLMNNIQAFLKAKNTRANDVYMTWLPLSHDMGLIGWHLNPLVAGASQYLIPPKTFVGNPGLWFDKISEHRASVISTPSFGLNHVLKFADLNRESDENSDTNKDWDLSCVRLVVTGADPISHTLCNRFLDAMAGFRLKKETMMPGYGLAEATLAVSVSPLGTPFTTHYLDIRSLGVGDRVKDIETDDPNAVPYVDEGPLITGFEARICDGDGKPLGLEVIGHIQLKGPSITAEYVNRPGATARAFSRDGWLKTGDLGFIRSSHGNHHMVITGRSKEIIIIGGLNFYPHDIERVVGQIPELRGRSVVAAGVYDRQTLSEELVLFVSHKKEIEAFIPLVTPIRDQVASQMNLPLSRVIPIPSIPRTTSGKVKRVKLVQHYNQGLYTPLVKEINQHLYARLEKIHLRDLAREEQVPAIVDFICDQVTTLKGGSKIDPQRSLMDHGIDSLMGIELRNCIEKALDISLPVSWFRTDESLIKFSEKILVKCEGQGPKAPEPIGTETDTPLLDQLKKVEQMSDDQVQKMIQALQE